MERRILTSPNVNMAAEMVRKLQKRVREDGEFKKLLQQDPEQALREFDHALETDPWTYRIVVVSLGAGLVVAASGAIYLSSLPKTEVPDVLVAIASGCIGALACLLSPQQT